MSLETRRYYVMIQMQQGVHSAIKFHFFMGQIALGMLDLGLDTDKIKPVLDKDQDRALYNVTDQVAFALGMAIGAARVKSAQMGMLPENSFTVEMIPHYLPDSMGCHEIWKKAKGGQES
jgi:hypothetical protein